MSKFYKLFIRPRTVFCATCFVLAALFSHNVGAGEYSVFTVENIKVDVTADSATIARKQAFAKAQYRAFKQLSDRLLSEDQQEFFTMPEPSVISTLVKDFEITEEQLSNIRYIGTYTFRFQNDAVRDYLGGKGFAYTDIGSKPVLVLPYYQQGRSTVLWGQKNPWLAAWSNAEFYQGLVPVVVPIGDVQDVSDMGDDEVFSYIPEQLQNMTERYAAGESVIMLAKPEWNERVSSDLAPFPDKLTVLVYRTERGRAELISRVSVVKEEILANQNIFDIAVNKTRKNLQTAWKKQTLVNAAQGNNIKVRVAFSSIREWVETQKKLRRVQGVSNTKLLSLKQNEANLELVFQGNEQRLRLALAQADMTLGAPHVGLAATPPYQGGQNSYGSMQPQTVSLVYDLYLNKYKRY